MRCKSRRVGGALKAEMSGFDRGEMAGRQTRKLDRSCCLHLIGAVKWWWACVCACGGGWLCVAAGGWLLKVLVGGLVGV